ncbi:MAG: hypothetical protein Q9174_005150, partial [Haloplaca sp. 1 TL-2023]
MSSTHSILDLTEVVDDSLPSRSVGMTSRKRSLDGEEDRSAKRQHQAPAHPGRIANAPTLDDQYVYIATAEEYGPYMETTQMVYEVYACKEDATQRLEIWQVEQQREEWKTTFDQDRCVNAVSEDDEGDGCRFSVQRMLVRPAGSAPPYPEIESSDESGPEEQSDESGSEAYAGDSEVEGNGDSDIDTQIVWRARADKLRRDYPVSCGG